MTDDKYYYLNRILETLCFKLMIARLHCFYKQKITSRHLSAWCFVII